MEPIPNEFFPPWSSHDLISKLVAEERLRLMTASYDQSYSVKTFIDVPRPTGFVYAPHFYDLNVLFGKVYRDMSVNVQGLSRGMFILKAIYFGVEGLLKNYTRQISTLKTNGQLSFGAVPTIIGEVGIPWDINDSRALSSGDYHKHVELLDALIEAMEQSQVGFTLWNYNPHNRVKHGDGWNKEDFSIICEEDQCQDIDNKKPNDVLYKNGRGLDAIIRPYAVKVAGFPWKTQWNRKEFNFEFHYVNGPTQFLSSGHEDSPQTKRTEIYLPAYHFDSFDQLRIQVKDGTFQLDRKKQSLYLDHQVVTPGFKHIVRVNVIGPIPKTRKIYPWYRLGVQDFFTLLVISMILLLILIVVDRTLLPFLQDAQSRREGKLPRITSLGPY